MAYRHQVPPSFDPQSMIVTGIGSNETNRIDLTQTYQAGTGNQSENLGHQVTIQLIWDAQNDQFEGKWYVKMSQYHDEDKFQLNFDGQ